MNIVVSDIEFHFTTDVATNPVPSTVSVTPVAPGLALTGATRSIYGTGLGPGPDETLGAIKLPNDASSKMPMTADRKWRNDVNIKITMTADRKRRNENGEKYFEGIAGMDWFS